MKGAAEIHFTNVSLKQNPGPHHFFFFFFLESEQLKLIKEQITGPDQDNGRGQRKRGTHGYPHRLGGGDG